MVGDQSLKPWISSRSLFSDLRLWAGILFLFGLVFPVRFKLAQDFLVSPGNPLSATQMEPHLFPPFFSALFVYDTLLQNLSPSDRIHP